MLYILYDTVFSQCFHENNKPKCWKSPLTPFYPRNKIGTGRLHNYHRHIESLGRLFQGLFSSIPHRPIGLVSKHGRFFSCSKTSGSLLLKNFPAVVPAILSLCVTLPESEHTNTAAGCKKSSWTSAGWSSALESQPTPGDDRQQSMRESLKWEQKKSPLCCDWWGLDV